MSDVNVDCKFTEANYNFRYRAGAIIVEMGEVLLVGSIFNGVYTYYTVGGGVHMGELSADAVIREGVEETGIKFEIERLAIIHESFYNDFHLNTVGKMCHQLAFYYLMKPRGTKELNEPQSKNSSGYNEKMHWIKISELNRFNVYPTFLKKYLTHPNEKLVHIITDNRDRNISDFN